MALRSRRGAPAALLGAAALVLLHATLLRTDPVADATVAQAPPEVRLWFDEEVEAAPDPVVVLDPSGRRVDHGGALSPDDPTELVARIDPSAPGTYTVRWRAVSDDGHVVDGTFGFNVQHASTPPASAQAGTPASSDAPLLAGGRAVHLAGLTLALGALAVLLLGGAAAPQSAVRRLARAGDVGALTILVGAAVMLVAQSAAMQGSMAAGLGHDAIREALHSRWANAWAVRAFGGAALLVVFGLVGRTGVSASTLGAGLAAVALLLLGTSLNGHAATTAPIWLSVAVDAAHLAATGAWLGGAACVAMSMAAAREDDAALEHVRRVVPRFSSLALLSVQLLVVTGFYQTWAHVARPALLTSTGYGETLLVKLALFALLAAPAAMNRFALKPRLAASAGLDPAGRAELLGRFRRVLGVEVALGACVLGCAALLSALPPAAEPMEDMHMATVSATAPTPEAPAARLFGASGDGRSIILSVDPGGLGSNQLRVSVRAPDGGPDSAAVALRAVPPEGSGVAPELIRLSSGSGEHHALLSFGTAGTWSLEVLVQDKKAAAFRLDVQP